MTEFEAGASRVVSGMLKCSKKGARSDEIFKLILIYLAVLQCDYWMQLQAKIVKNEPRFYPSFPEMGEAVCVGQS